MFGQDIGIDLGTKNVMVYVNGKGIVLNEPSVVAIDDYTEEIIGVGHTAQEMIGRAPGRIKVIRPLKDGVISDYQYTETMLRMFLKKVCKSSIFKPRVVVCTPSAITEVEYKAIRDAVKNAGARRVEMIEEPKAAAIGAGIDISKPSGVMIVDIGGGTTDIAVISLGDVVVSTSVKIAGDKFDDDIIRYVRNKHKVLIGERMAEEIKINIGCMVKREDKIEMTVKGRCLVNGLPKTIVINSDEIYEALHDSAETICDAVHSIMEKTPPELVGDISERGVLMTGGGAMVYGFDKMVANHLGVDVAVADDALSCVAKGTGMSLKYIDRGNSSQRRH